MISSILGNVNTFFDNFKYFSLTQTFFRRLKLFHSEKRFKQAREVCKSQQCFFQLKLLIDKLKDLLFGITHGDYNKRYYSQ